MPRPSRFADIVAASGRVFQEKGFDGARLEDIAQEVGIYKGSLYHYIDTKEDLLFAVVREPAERILEETRQLVETDLSAEDKLHRLARLHVSVLASAHPFTAVYIEEIAGKHRFPEWEAKDREYATMVEAIFGELPGTTQPRIAARAFIGSLNWMTRWYRFDGSMDAETIADEIAEVFLRGLARAPGDGGGNGAVAVTPPVAEKRAVARRTATRRKEPRRTATRRKEPRRTAGRP